MCMTNIPEYVYVAFGPFIHTMIHEVTQEKLVQNFEKYMKMKLSNLEANQRYSMTDKGKEKKKQIL